MTKLTLVFHEPWSEDNSYEQYILPLAGALSTNSTLSHVKISTGKAYPTERVLQAMVSIFRTNFTLQNLEVFEHMSRVQCTSYKEIENLQDGNEKRALLLGKRIQYYTMLNCSGRGALLGNAASPIGRQPWIEKLVEFSYSLDHVYFFLQTNPTLCSTANSSDSAQKFIQNTSTRKRGRQASD